MGRFLISLAFTVILTASSISNVGVGMFDASMSWLMTSLNPDPIMVSAVQVATSLPLFLLTFPAGALVDIVDARRLLIGSQAAVVAISVVFAALVSFHLVTPPILLGTTFLLGLGGALAAPAWLLITPMLVPGNELDSAIAINNTSYNVSRAIGPALGGFAIAAFSIDVSVLVLLRRQYRAACRDPLVARGPRRIQETLARRAADERAHYRPALRPIQSRHRLDADPRRRVFFCSAAPIGRCSPLSPARR